MKNNNRQRVRINDYIRIPKVQVINNGENLGIMPTSEAKKLAAEVGLDLVEVSPTSKPPVCRIMDYGKYKYEQSVKERKQKKSQKSQEIKEIRLRSSIADHDIETKIKSARKFLASGQKVQFKLQFKNRENAHKDLGFVVMDKIIKSLDEVCKVAKKPVIQGRFLIGIIEPK